MNELKKYRAKNKMTISQMAKFIGVSTSYYEKIEYDTKQPSFNFLKKVKNKIPKINIDIFFEN